MKVLFINPAVRPDSPKLMLNVGLAYVVSAAERAGIAFEILDIDAHRYSDEEVERRIRTMRFDVAAIGTLVSQYTLVKGIAAMIRQHHPRAVIVVGNTLGTSVPRLLLEKTEVDVAVRGEGDITAVELFQAVAAGSSLDEVAGICFKRDGEIVETAPRRAIACVDDIPFPNYDLFDIDIYLEKSRLIVPAPEKLPIAFDDLVAMPVSTARGCPFQCNFCYHAFKSLKYRHRSPESICAEIERWKTKYGANYVSFWDELSLYDIKSTARLADLLIEKNLRMFFVGSARSELLDWSKLEVARQLRKAGCKGLSFALESGNESILRAMNKRNHVADFITQAKVCHEAGLEVYTSLVFGYPQETPATIANTFDVCSKARVYPSVGYLQPSPGTPIYEYARQKGYIGDEELYLMSMGDRQDLRMNLTGMSPDLMEGLIHEHLRALNDELGIGLPESQLIKTQVYRSARQDAPVAQAIDSAA
ncbi:MAG: radical SAM protein [Pseudomonadota bacterium]